MKPGATTRSEASITFFALSATLPISAIRPFAIATSARRDGPPVPSTTVPFLISRSYDIRGFLPLAPGKAHRVDGFILCEACKPNTRDDVTLNGCGWRSAFRTLRQI